MHNLVSICEYIHGVLILVNSVGVLIIGKPGVGKSKLAYDLITQGHSLVADDIVKCRLCEQQLIGSLHNKEFNGKIFVRNMGMVDVNGIHGDSVKSQAKISVCIGIGFDAGHRLSVDICDVKVPFYNINAGNIGCIYSIIQGLPIS